MDDEDGRDHNDAIEDELKREIFDGKVLAKTEPGFQLCKDDVIEATQRRGFFFV